MLVLPPVAFDDMLAQRQRRRRRRGHAEASGGREANVTLANAFIDPACTRAAEGLQGPAPVPFPPAPPLWIAEASHTTCTTVASSGGHFGPFTIFDIGPIDPPAPLYWLGSGSCALFDMPGGPVSGYVATTPVDPNLFPLMPPELQ